MSYAGTYGSDETCPHDCYWRSCRYCSDIGPRPTSAQIEMSRQRQRDRKRDYLAHPDDARSIPVMVRQIVVYDAECPNPRCEWKRIGATSRATLESDLRAHLDRACEVAAQWRSVDPNTAYVARRESDGAE